MKFRGRLATLTLLFFAALIGAFFLAGPERVWALFGPADLGPVAFETLERRTTPNDALACPPGVCQAQSDVTPPEYGVGAADLRLAFAKMIAAEPRIAAAGSDAAAMPGEMTDRYIQRSALMRVASGRRTRVSVASELGSRLDQFKMNRLPKLPYRKFNVTTLPGTC